MASRDRDGGGSGAELANEEQKSSLNNASPSIGVKTIYEVIRFDSTPFSVRHHDGATTEPISFYLSNLEELLSWKPSALDAFNVAMVPLAQRLPTLQSNRPRTLVCHDMKGGYLEDRFIQGTDTPNPYAFYHWQYIDVFVYFSHQMFTVPPVCWTNAAHRHGVSVLGTFITEWDNGGKTCESFLAGEEATYFAVADQMVRVAQFYQFDGWLVNIENKLSLGAVQNAPKFLRYLTDQLHAKVPGGLIIWYDSVIQDGELKWQNELNEKNRIFFESCDGIFTNYNWAEGNLQYMERMLSEMGGRLTDVYVGVDVFARSEVVGGRYETNKSLQMIRQYGMSAALFAPGWVYECLGKENFLQNESKFWGLLEEHLPTHSLCSLPLATSFCLGFGQKRFSYGKEVDVGSWCNLSAQELQPLIVNLKSEEGDGASGWVRTQSCHRDAWNGGSSLLLEGKIRPELPGVSVRLFSFQMPAPSKLLLSMVYKLEGGADVNVALELTTRDAPSCSVSKISEPVDEHLAGLPTLHTHHPKALAESDPSFVRAIGPCWKPGDGSWTLRCYEAELSDCLLEDLFIHISRPSSNPEEEIHFTCRLGEIRILDGGSLSAPKPRVQDLTASQILWRRSGTPISQLYLSLTLNWSYPVAQARQFRIFCRGVTCHRASARTDTGQPHLIGLAHAAAYRVVDMEVPEAGSQRRLEFLVQPVTTDGFVTEQAQWGQVALEYSDRTHTLV